MKTDIYLHRDRHLCALVSEGNKHKFVDHLESFCDSWQTLLCQAKTGFDAFPFYDRYKHHDVDFWDRYLHIAEGDEDYEFLGCVYDGVIDFDADRLNGKGEFFAPLRTSLKIADACGFCSIHNIIFTDDSLVLSSNSEVLACTNIKIPFEPTAEQAAFRDLLRTKLKELQPADKQILRGKYGCPSSQTADVENALFYNIGTAAFRSIAGKKTPVYFERLQPNDLPAFDEVAFRYFYHYVLLPGGKQTYWWEHDLICKWNGIPLAKVCASSKPADYFLAMKQHPDAVTCFADAGNDCKLGLKIRLFIPKTAEFTNIISIMKPMIDGVICAFHAPKDLAAEEVSRRLHISRDIFLSSENTCLGEHCYIRPYANSVKWDPQDDRLDYVFIEPVTTDEEAFSFSGQIFAIPGYM